MKLTFLNLKSYILKEGSLQRNVFFMILGNGFFEKSSGSAKIEVLVSNTEVLSYDYTYYGKNNKFYGVLHDENGKNLVNFPLTFTIVDSKGNHNTITTYTDVYGRADVILSLDVGEYDVNVSYLGDFWYKPSFSTSHIVIKPADDICKPLATLLVK